jgi:hypothetical protein
VIADKNPLFDDDTNQTLGKRPNQQKRQQTAKARKISDDAIHEVFTYWREKISPRSRAILDDARRTKIGWAIHDYGIQACKQAIDGCLKSGWHMGNNPSNKKYNDVELIFRHAANVERFIAMTEQRDAKQEFINNPEW